MLKRSWRGIISVLFCVLTMIVGVALIGCQSAAVSSSQEQASSTFVDLSDEYYIDPDVMEKVLEEIYQDVPQLLRDSVSEPTQEEIEEVLKLNPSYIDDCFIRYSSGSFGLADIYVIKPSSESVYALKEELEDLRMRRVNEFEQYDVYDALTIAQNAEVEQIGTYVVLVMMEDADEVMSKLKPIIPTGY